MVGKIPHGLNGMNYVIWIIIPHGYGNNIWPCGMPCLTMCYAFWKQYILVGIHM